MSSRLPTLEERLKDLEKSYTGLLDKRKELEEGRAVVRETGVFFRSGAAEQALARLMEVTGTQHASFTGPMPKRYSSLA